MLVVKTKLPVLSPIIKGGGGVPRLWFLLPFCVHNARAKWYDDLLMQQLKPNISCVRKLSLSHGRLHTVFPYLGNHS